MTRLYFFILVFISIITLNASDDKTSKDVQIGMYEHLGEQIPLNLTFTDEYNNTKTLKEFMGNTPTVLTLNYFTCPSLCSPLLAGVSTVLDKMDLKPYLDYKAITISIDPNDSPQSALKKKTTQLGIINKSFPPQSWSFLTTTNQKTIDEITDAVGFKYEKRVKDGIVDYLHPGAIIVLSPTGKVSRYLNGIEFLPFDLKLAIYGASKEKTGPTIAKTLLFCFAYDPKNKTYVFQAEKVLGSLMFLIVGGFFTYLIKSGRKNGSNDR